MSIYSDLDDGIKDLNDAGVSTTNQRTWVIEEVKEYNKTPNPHAVTVGELNDFLQGRNLLPRIAGNDQDIV